MKVSISVPDEVVQKADYRAKQLGISRSAFITMTLSEALMQKEFMQNMPELLRLAELQMSAEKK